MESIFKKKIVEYINRKDPQREIVSEISPSKDFSGGKVVYNKDNLILHRAISALTDEEYVRAYLVVKLAKELKYPSLCVEIEKEYEAGRPKTTKPRIDIIVRDKKKTFLFIEVKTPEKYDSDRQYIEGQLFKLAKLEGGPENVKYLVYYSVELEADEIEDQTMIIDYPLYPSFQSWVEKGNISLDSLPIEYGIARKSVYVNKTRDDLSPNEKALDKRVTKARFDSLREDLHDVLWGGGGMFYNEIFSNLVKLFLAKIYDEETTPYGKYYRFQIEFKNGDPETPTEIYQKTNRLFKEAQKVYLGYPEDLVKNSVGIDKERISENKIAYVVERLQEISLLENEHKDEGDLLGNFFEGIVSKGFKQDKGQFFTHPNIVRFVIHALDIDSLAIDLVNGSENLASPRLPFICDPACGSGTFLIEAMKYATKTIKTTNRLERSKVVNTFLEYNFPKTKENTWAREYIYGMEINPDLALATKVNMVLHGDGSINIFAKDGLLPFKHYEIPNKVSVLSKSDVKRNYSYPSEVNEGFDIVISNPPFSVILDTETKRTLAERFMYSAKKNSENLFIERWYQLLKEYGKLGVVLPGSVFDTAENMYIRLFLYKYFKIDAVVSLPGGKDGAFLPYTPTKTSLLFAQKKTRREVEAWEKTWRQYNNQFQKLRRKIAKYKKAGVENEEEAKSNITYFLKTYFDVRDEELSSRELLNKYRQEIIEVKTNPDWWIFDEVSRHFNYKILVAQVKDIGYRRTENREFRKPNQLFQIDHDGSIVIDVKNPKTVLDWLKCQKRPNGERIFEIDLYDTVRSSSLRLDFRFHKYMRSELPKLMKKFRKPVYPFRNVIKSIRNGKDVKREHYSLDASGLITETDYLYLTVNNIKPDNFVLDEIIYLKAARGQYLEKHKLEKGDIIITRSGTVGVCKVFDLNENKIYIPSGYLIIVKVDESKVKGKFIEYYLNSLLLRQYFDVFGTGKTQQNISQSDVRKIPIPGFTPDEQDLIIREFEAQKFDLLVKITKREDEIVELRKRMEKILPQKILL